jgi:2-polyprenyl-3-methyl-5-hydroxy-6-metoxy-1,4-benzoquinol methylase
MRLNKADRDWENFAKISPYYGVIISEGYKTENLTDERIADFFTTGEKFIETILDDINQHLDGEFQPVRCLDFGCGVGRLTVPLAMRFPQVVGMDISETMLAEARANSRRFGLDNVEFVQSDDALTRVKGTFDLINSYIVMQHISRRRGEIILRRMIELLNENGIAALQFTYEKQESLAQRIKSWVHARVPFAHNFINLAKGRKFDFPYTQINRYDLNRLMRILQHNGCEHAYLRFTNHEGLLGMVLMFQKKRVALIN